MSTTIRYKSGDTLTGKQLLFYTDTYCDGLTDDGRKYQYNGIIQCWGVVHTLLFNIFREAEFWLCAIRTKYFDTILECNSHIVKYRMLCHDTSLPPSTREHAVLGYAYWTRKRDLYIEAFMRVTLVQHDFTDGTSSLHIDDPAGLYVFPDDDYKLDIKKLVPRSSMIFFDLQPLLPLDNKLGRSPRLHSGYIDNAHRIARGWRE